MQIKVLWYSSLTVFLEDCLKIDRRRGERKEGINLYLLQSNVAVLSKVIIPLNLAQVMMRRAFFVRDYN